MGRSDETTTQHTRWLKVEIIKIKPVWAFIVATLGIAVLVTTLLFNFYGKPIIEIINPPRSATPTAIVRVTPVVPTGTATLTPTPTSTVAPTNTPAHSSSGGPTYPEMADGVTHTWTNYMNAGGYEGPTIAAYQTVQIACALTGFKVADGNTWWYRIASSPWNNTYYASADAFCNAGQTCTNPSQGPLVDPSVPHC